MFLRNTAPHRACTAALLALALVACSVAGPRGEPATAPAKAVGYLAKAEVPDSLLLVPPPPADGSPGIALDQAVSAQALAMQGSARFAQANRDADLSFPVGAGQFACALGVPIDLARTPHLYHLLERSRIDASAATKAAKNHYQRPRPFTRNGEPTCTPEEEEELRHNGSYPSGHTSIGWAWALILSEVDPTHADVLFERGRNYGESRLVCNVHWQSDIVEGRHMGAAAVARLHDNAQFRADLAAARKEVAAARAAGLTAPAADCDAQKAALKRQPESAL